MKMRKNENKKNKRTFRRLLERVAAAAALCAVLVLAFAMPALAADGSGYHDSDPYDYITERFDVSVVAEENHVFHVTEQIDVNFIQPHHGITRYIPVYAKLYSVRKIRVSGGKLSKSSEFGSYGENGRTGTVNIRIGDEHKTLTGKQSYMIQYDLVCNEDDDLSADYLSLDLLPTDWGTSIREADLQLRLPEKVDPSLVSVYSGIFGSTQLLGGEEGPVPRWSSDGLTLHIHASDLPRGNGLTVQAALKEGYWKGARSNSWLFLVFLAVIAAVPVLTAALYICFCRKPKVVQTVEFYPPEGMTPAELGYVVDGHVDKGDMSSMLMYFADRKYLKIHEYKKNKFEVIRARDIGNAEKAFAVTMFNAIFSGSREKGAAAKLDKLPSDFGSKVSSAKTYLKDYYSGEKSLYTAKSKACRVIASALIILCMIAAVIISTAYSRDPLLAFTVMFFVIPLAIGLWLMYYGYDKRSAQKRVKNLLIRAAGIVLFLTGAFFSGSLIQGEFWKVRTGYRMWAEPRFGDGGSLIPAAVYMAALIIAAFLAVRMRARTEKSAEWVGKILGFREFIRTAEMDRLRMLSGEDPEYFYHIMPYAYVLGMSTQWAKKFMNIKVSQPSWYSSYDARGFVFSTLWYSRMSRSCAERFSGGFSNYPDSGSHGSFGGGGYSGGGFSGGGFGGGGGGAW